MDFLNWAKELLRYVLEAKYWSWPMIVDNNMGAVIFLYSWTKNFGQSHIASPCGPSGFDEIAGL
jgi:hypothetical protein